MNNEEHNQDENQDEIIERERIGIDRMSNFLDRERERAELNRLIRDEELEIARRAMVREEEREIERRTLREMATIQRERYQQRQRNPPRRSTGKPLQ
jgi:hypothetical protein